LVFGKLEKTKRGYYEVTIEPLADSPNDFDDYEITDEFLRRIEAQVRNNPAHYLWTHNRFKHKDKIPKRFR
jgi:KDO2-lipid IV(A) lauroyltransferase